MFGNHLDQEETAACFPLTVVLMPYDSKCSVTHPDGAVDWSVVCDCGMS